MARARNSVGRSRRRGKTLAAVKGFRGRRKNTIRIALQAAARAGVQAYRDRRQRKRVFRSLWIQRINAAARAGGLTYGRLICGLSRAGVDLDRKVLADLALHSPEDFSALVEKARRALS